MYADAAQWRQDLTASQSLAEELIAMKGSITKSAANLLAQKYGLSLPKVH